MGNRVLAAVVAIAGLATAAPVPFPKPRNDPKAMLAQMQGLWSFVDFGRTAGKVTHPFPMFARVEGDKWTFTQKRPDGSMNPTRGYTIHIDPMKSPVWIDFKNSPTDAEPFLLGVFEVGRDELRVAYVLRSSGAGRPAELKAVRPADYLLILKRVNKP